MDEQGNRLLTAVERIVADCENLIARVEAVREETRPTAAEDEGAHLAAAAERIIASYSNRSAIAGGLSALPALLPGAGTVVAIVGGALADMALTLKYESEMALCLTHLYGHDIREERARELAYMLASVHTYDAESGRNYFVDLAEAGAEAALKYAPRQAGKTAVSVVTRLAWTRTSRSVLRALPLVGAVVGASTNKLLTTFVGRRCVAALERRRHDVVVDVEEEPVVEATVRADLDGEGVGV